MRGKKPSVRRVAELLRTGRTAQSGRVGNAVTPHLRSPSTKCNCHALKFEIQGIRGRRTKYDDEFPPCTQKGPPQVDASYRQRNLNCTPTASITVPKVAMMQAAARFCNLDTGAACCSHKGLFPDRLQLPGVTRNGFASRPSLCEGICRAVQGCNAFSHSASSQHCVLCPDCERRPGSAHANAGAHEYSSWRRIRPNESFSAERLTRTAAGLRSLPAETTGAHAEPPAVGRSIRARADSSAATLLRGRNPVARCVAPRPCATSVAAVAILFRGESCEG